MPYYWFSFSKNGKNQGVISVKSTTFDKAVSKAKKLGIVPKYDDVEFYEAQKQEIPLDVLVSPQEMNNMEYKSNK